VRIAIEATALMKPQRTGVARYVVNLVRSLAEEAPDDEFLLCYRLSRYARRRHRIPLPGSNFSQHWVQGPIRPDGVDLVHGPAGRLRIWRGAKSVATVHDVFSLVSTEFATAKFRAKRKRAYLEIAEKADRIICVSPWTRDTFWAHHPIPESRFVVIPHGVEDRFNPEAEARIPAIRANYGILGPYVLFVGELSVRKNVDGMLEALSMMSADGPRLVLAGKPSHGHENIEKQVESRGLADRVQILGYFPDEDMPGLLAGAECLLYPSFLEGFGLPALEAMACGTPVVTTDRGALPHTTGGIHVTVDPDHPESIRDGLLRLLSTDELRADLTKRGLAWAALYRWNVVAKKTLEVYRGLVR
jgi:glycosyltransferase involved in cell wall biosynthesis